MNQNLFLKPEEAKFLGMAVASSLDSIQTIMKNPAIPWTPESRKTLKEMDEAGQQLKRKLVKLGFDVRPLPDLEDGEELDYITKES